MATTGAQAPTSATTVAEDPWLDNDWTTPANVFSDNSQTANITAATFDSPDDSYVLKAVGFDFSVIPDGAPIRGVTCKLNAYYRSGQGTGAVNLLQLLNTSMVKVGTNQCASATMVALTTSPTTIITKGSGSDTWGNSLTAAWVKDPDFGVAIGIEATAANADVDVDYVTLEVTYDQNVQMSGVFASGSLGQVTAIWSMDRPDAFRINRRRWQRNTFRKFSA